VVPEKNPKGVVESCDWVRVENDLIKQIRSFYDSALIREVLSPAEQDSLAHPSCKSGRTVGLPTNTLAAMIGNATHHR